MGIFRQRSFAFATSSLNPSRISTAPHHAQGMFKLEINRRWGPTAARAWARLFIDHIPILMLGFDNETELGAQARRRQFY
jgi:hypothetical protein